MWQERLTEFVALWVIIDPLGSLSVFLAVTAGLDRRCGGRSRFCRWAWPS